jgi:hypothetical protein
VIAAAEDGNVNLEIRSDCQAIQKLGEHLKQVDPFKEISSRRSMPQTLEMGLKYCYPRRLPGACGDH